MARGAGLARDVAEAQAVAAVAVLAARAPVVPVAEVAGPVAGLRVALRRLDLRVRRVVVTGFLGGALSGA